MWKEKENLRAFEEHCNILSFTRKTCKSKKLGRNDNKRNCNPTTTSKIGPFCSESMPAKSSSGFPAWDSDHNHSPWDCSTEPSHTSSHLQQPTATLAKQSHASSAAHQCQLWSASINSPLYPFTSCYTSLAQNISLFKWFDLNNALRQVHSVWSCFYPLSLNEHTAHDQKAWRLYALSSVFGVWVELKPTSEATASLVSTQNQNGLTWATACHWDSFWQGARQCFPSRYSRQEAPTTSQNWRSQDEAVSTSGSGRHVEADWGGRPGWGGRRAA